PSPNTQPAFQATQQSLPHRECTGLRRPASKKGYCYGINPYFSFIYGLPEFVAATPSAELSLYETSASHSQRLRGVKLFRASPADATRFVCADRFH
ncbi:MAG: hypothetical protein WA618_16325, partial [Terriglobales bacterium]